MNYSIENIKLMAESFKKQTTDKTAEQIHAYSKEFIKKIVSHWNHPENEETITQDYKEGLFDAVFILLEFIENGKSTILFSGEVIH